MKEYAIVSVTNHDIIDIHDITLVDNITLFEIFPLKLIIEIILSIDCYSYRSDDLVIELYSRIDNIDITENLSTEPIVLMFDIIAQLLDQMLHNKLNDTYCEYKFVKWLDGQSILLEKK